LGFVTHVPSSTAAVGWWLQRLKLS
jgi:hypothetical protein